MVNSLYNPFIAATPTQVPRTSNLSQQPQKHPSMPLEPPDAPGGFLFSGPHPKISASVNDDSTRSATNRNSHRKESRRFPSVHPSTMLKARNRFQSRIFVRSVVRRSSLTRPRETNCRHSANG